MKLSSEQLERLAERVFQVLQSSGHMGFDNDVDVVAVSEKCVQVIHGVFEDDSKMEDRLSREAERLVQQQHQVAKESSKPLDELVSEVKVRLARSKKVDLGDGPERADSLAEKVLRGVWRVDGIDFFSEDHKIRNCIARAIYRFRMEDERVLDAVEKITQKRTTAAKYSHEWCIMFDKCFNEVKSKIAAHQTSGMTQKNSIAPDTAAAQISDSPNS
jgi:hypothetical protein